MVTEKRIAAVTVMLLACLLLSACGTHRFVTLRTRCVARVDIPEEIQKVCLVGIRDYPGKPGSGNQVRSALMQKLRDSGRYELVEREALRAIEAERMLDAAGMTAAPEMLSNPVFDEVHAIVLGSISNYGYTYKRWTEQRTKLVPDVQITWSGGQPSYTTRMRTVHYTVVCQHATASLTCNFRFADKVRGKIMAVKDCSASWDSGKVEDGTVAGEATKINELIAVTTEDFRREIAPWVLVEKYELIYRFFNHFEPGRQWAEEELYTEAMEFFKKGSEGDPEDPYWIYNLGLCHEALGQYEDARECYEKAFRLYPTYKAFMAAKKRAKQKIIDMEAGKITPLVPETAIEIAKPTEA